MEYILRKIDSITMYRVVLYVLSIWVFYAVVLSLLGFLYYKPVDLFVSLITIASSSIFAHYLLRWASNAYAANIESSLITAFILFLIFEPATDSVSLAALAIVSLIAILSKYLVKWRNVHIFNPVAGAVVLSTILSVGFATWWIGTPAFFPIVLLGGLIITQKIRRFPMVLTTLGVGFLSYILIAFLSGTLGLSTVTTFLLSWPMLFFTTVMVTEPLSTPAGKRYQLWYATFIGILSGIPFTLFGLSNSLALTLIIANAVSFPLLLTGRPKLTLHSIQKIADHVYELVFTTSFRFQYEAGQYLEWALPHTGVDSRGMRRYFTIASAPEEKNIVLGIKTYERPSSYKTSMLHLKPGDDIFVSSLDGDFVLPTKPETIPMVFIAGGIGVTPYRSMVSHLIATNTKIKATLFYFVRHQNEIVWDNIWKEAATIGLQTVYVVSEANAAWNGEIGTLTPALISRYIDTPQDYRYYLSGPPGMVRSYTSLLESAGIPSTHIKRDYFPGLA